MIDSEDEIEPQSLEYLEHKKRRQQRKKEKMQLLEARYKLLENHETSVSLVDGTFDGLSMDGTPPKPKRNRRKMRTRKNKTSEDGECLLTDINFETVMPSVNLNDVTIDLSNLVLHSSDIITTSKKKQKMRVENNSTNTKRSQKCSSSKQTQHVTEKTNLERNKKKNDTPNETQEISTSNSKKTKVFKNSEQNVKFSGYMAFEEVKNGLKSGELISGYIRINPKDFKTAYIRNSVKDEQDILILSVKDRNGALEGDNVVIKLKDESEWKSKQKIGYVVLILDKVHARTAIGTLKLMSDKNKRFALFVPRDSRVPRMKIPFTDWPVLFFEHAEQYEQVLFLAKIIKWTDVRFAMGSILENIGMAGNIKTETIAILRENNLDVSPYSEEMKQYFPRTGKINPKEFEYRLDMRKECVFTIDPLTARDLDDAVSCKQLPNGNLEIGVHISDASYYLKEGTPLDRIVSQRATSIYMVESVYHMLPKEMCMLCSLLPGEDKLAFSVFWEMTRQGKVISHKFSRTVVNSCVQLAYEHAQEIIENPKKIPTQLPLIHNGFKAENLCEVINNLHKIASILRQSRYQSGALRIDQPKLSFSLDPATCLPTSYCLYENKECHRLIEEFMLLANITVATRLRNDYPDIAFLRSHSPPHSKMMQALKIILEKVGIHLDVSSAGDLQQTLWKYSGNDILSESRMMVLSLLCAKAMVRANYFCPNGSNNTEDYWHYALSVPLYTHFTSPIRRYADIMVHRLLASSLGYTEKPNWEPKYVMSVAENCNMQKYNAKRAGEQSIDLYLIQWISQNQPVIEKAVVMDVKDNSFDAIIIATGYTIRIYLDRIKLKTQFLNKDDDEVEESEDGKKLLSVMLEWPEHEGKPSTKQIISIFSIITVSLTKKEKQLKLDATLIRPDV